MRRQDLDYIFVPSGLLVLLCYHIWLFYLVAKHPTKTVMGVNAISRRTWVKTTVEESGKNRVLAVQTLRNNIMASTLLPTTAIMLSSLIAVLMSNGQDLKHRMVFGDMGELGFSIKYFSLLFSFLAAFLMNVQSIRYYSHANILINVPLEKMRPKTSFDYVVRAVNCGSLFWLLGLRSFYFSFPLFFKIFGPMLMFLCCIIMVVLLYFLDTCSMEDELP